MGFMRVNSGWVGTKTARGQLYVGYYSQKGTFDVYLLVNEADGVCKLMTLDGSLRFDVPSNLVFKTAAALAAHRESLKPVDPLEVAVRGTIKVLEGANNLGPAQVRMLLESLKNGMVKSGKLL